MIELLRIYSKAFLENVTIEELPPDPILIRHEKCQFSPTSLRAPRDKYVYLPVQKEKGS
jgi:hypothetical protein